MNQNYEPGAIAMHGINFQRILAALERGELLDKQTAGDKFHCDYRTSQRILSYLHIEKHIRICGWRFAGTSHVRIPIYQIIDSEHGTEKDVAPPPPVRDNAAEYQRKRRESPEVRIAEASAKKNKRVVEKAKKKFNESGGSIWKSLLRVG